MLERVMRRFGVTNLNQERPPTYLEEMLPHILAKAKKSIPKNSNTDPITLVAREIVSTEVRRLELTAPTFTNKAEDEAAQAFFRLIADNDYLPPTCQLARDDLQATWQLLHAYAMGSEQTSSHFEQVLALLESKFNGGLYPQASLLLRLFETTPSRQRNNERTLFYEEMIARFGARRVELLSRSQCKKYRLALKEHKDLASRLVAATKWLNQFAGVCFNVPLRKASEIEAWNKALECVQDPALRGAARRQLPPVRLRNLLELGSGDLAPSLQPHLLPETLFKYASRLLKCTYFIVLVTGKTGFEPFIRSFFDWFQHNFKRQGTRLLPEIHKRTTVGEESLDPTVNDIVEHWMADGFQSMLKGIDEERLTEALSSLIDQLESLDPNDIPTGEYDLLGLILDKLTGLSSEDPTILLRIHRIC